MTKIREKTARRWLTRNRWKIAEYRQGKDMPKKWKNQHAACRAITDVRFRKF